MLAMDEPCEEGRVFIVRVCRHEQDAGTHTESVDQLAQRRRAAILREAGGGRTEEKKECPEQSRCSHPRPASFFARVDPAPSRPPLCGARTSVTIRACCSA